MYVFDKETGDTYIVDFAHLQIHHCHKCEINYLRKPVDLGEDSEQCVRALRFYRKNPELDWDGDF